MKKILKLIATLTLMFSCFYLAISLFLSHLMINDILTNVVESSTVTDALVDSCKDAFKTLNVEKLLLLFNKILQLKNSLVNM